MKKVLMIAIIAIFMIGTISCTENSRVKNWGGSGKIELPANQKLVNVTWKESNLWYLSRPMKDGEVAESYTFCEESSWGLVEGSYTFIETK